MNFQRVADHHEFCEGMPEAAEMVLDEDDTAERREWEVPRKVWIPTQWADQFADHPTFATAISRIDNLLLQEDRDTVAMACCAEFKGSGHQYPSNQGNAAETYSQSKRGGPAAMEPFPG